MTGGDKSVHSSKLGFLGGTFNPIHEGHLRLAEEARSQFDLDRVLFIPNRIPPHRNPAAQDLPAAEKRYCMTVLATLQNPFFLASNIELEREGVSYTYDTAALLKKQYPDFKLFLICGADTFIHHTWHRLADLLDLLDGLLLASRGNQEIDQVSQKFKSDFPQLSQKLGKIQMTPLDISATDIRNRVRRGQRIKDLVPESVELYIERYQIYREVHAA